APTLGTDASLHNLAYARRRGRLPRNELNAAVTLLRAMRLVLVLCHRFCEFAALRRSLDAQHQSAESRATRNRRALAKEAPAERIECLAGHLLSLRPRQFDIMGKLMPTK